MKKRILATALIALALSACTAVPPDAADVTPVADVSPEPSPTLAPYSSGEIGTRRYAATTLDVIPRDDYGAVYPYLGAVMSVQDNYFANGSLRLFGFATAGGEIICDAAFDEVRTLTSPDGTVVYAARRPSSRHAVAFEDGNLVHGYNEGEPGETALVASDGSYAVSFGEIYDAGCGYLTVYDAEYGWTVTDFRGEYVLPRDFGSAYPVFASETDGGDVLFIVARLDADDGTFAYNRTYYRYVDASGATVIPETKLYNPPYGFEVYGTKDEVMRFMLDQLRFNDGVAPRFTQDGSGTYGYIDGTGAWVIEPTLVRGTIFYQYAPAFENGRCIAVVDGGDERVLYRLIDKSGNILLESQNYLDRHGDIFVQYLNGAEKYFDRDGNPVSYAATTRIDNGFGWEIAMSGNNTEVFNDGRYVFSYDNDSYGYAVTADRFVVRKNLPYDYRQPPLCDVQIRSGNGEVLFKADDVKSFDMYGEYAAVARGRFGGLMNDRGEWIVRVNLSDSMDD